MRILRKKQSLPIVFLDDNGLFGYHDGSGNVLIEARYIVAYPFDAKTRTASVIITKGSDYVFIDEFGCLTHDKSYNWVITDHGDTVVTTRNFPHVINPENGEADGLATAEYTTR